MAEVTRGAPTAVPATANGRSVETAVFRCTPCLAFWALAAAVLVYAIPLFDLAIEAGVVALFVALYCVQAFLVDLPGVRVDGATVGAPYRPWPEIPVAVFGRRNIPFERIERIVVLRRGPPSLAGIRTKTRTTCGLAFSSKEARRAFYRRVTDLAPSVPIVKST